MGIMDDANIRIDELTEKVAYLTGQVDLLVRMHLGLEDTPHVANFSKFGPPADELDEAVEKISGTLDDLAEGTLAEDEPDDGED